MTNSICTQTDLSGIELSHLFKLSTVFKEMRLANYMTDTVVVCGEQLSQAHRVILSAISPYFCSALTKGWLETSSGCLKLPDSSVLNLDAILTFAYTGSLDDIPFDTETLMDILENSNYFMVEGLIQNSFHALASLQLTTTRFVEMLDYVEELNNLGLVSQVVTGLARNFDEIIQTEDFLLLKKHQIEMVLRNPALAKTGKSEVVTALLQWTEVKKEREEFMRDLLAIVFEHWCPECARKLMKDKCLMKWSVRTIRGLEEFLNVQETDRVTEQNLLFFGNVSSASVVTMYSVQNNDWSATVELPFLLENGMDMAVHKCHTYFFGGWGEGGNINPSKAVIKYCPFTNSELAYLENGLLVPVYDAEVAVVGDHVYVVNGVDKNYTIQNIVQRYNTIYGCCEMVAPTNVGHYSPTVLPCDKGLYVVGSFDTDRLVERYSIADNQWTIVTEIPGSVTDCVAAFCREKLFVVRESSESQFHIYDVSSNEWTIRKFRGGPSRINWLWAAVVRNQSILVLCDLDDVSNIVYQYDIETAQWLSQSSINAAMGEVSNCCCTDMPFTKGFCTN